MSSTIISIAMATYNGEHFLREQMDSILAQTVSDWELIACDDCSSDGTWEILQEYAKSDSRIKIHRNEQNLGFKKNFEKAISLCTGEYIALSDQDDIWTENHLEVLVKNIGEKSIAGANAELIDKEGQSKNILLNKVDGFDFYAGEDKFLWRIIFRSGPIQGTSMLIKRDSLAHFLPIPSKVKFHDAWFIACACLDKGISYSFQVITKYRQHGNNVTFESHNKNEVAPFCILFRKIKHFFLGTFTDRFAYCSELEKRYGKINEDFCTICEIVDRIKKKSLRFSDIKTLWKNYEFIMAQKGHRKFFEKLIAWTRWQAYD